MKAGIIDRILGKIISRKFTVFLTATGLMIFSDLTSDTWGMIAIVYIGSQGVIDAALSWKHGPGQ
jgi:urocanate hydratase